MKAHQDRCWQAQRVREHTGLGGSETDLTAGSQFRETSQDPWAGLSLTDPAVTRYQHPAPWTAPGPDKTAQVSAPRVISGNNGLLTLPLPPAICRAVSAHPLGGEGLEGREVVTLSSTGTRRLPRQDTRRLRSSGTAPATARARKVLQGPCLAA